MRSPECLPRTGRAATHAGVRARTLLSIALVAGAAVVPSFGAQSAGHRLVEAEVDVDDAIGDAADPRGDLVTASLSAPADGGLVFVAKMQAATDATIDPNWVSGRTTLSWFIDTDLDD